MRTPRLPAVDWTDAPRRFNWTRPFCRKTKSGFCACAITFQTQSTTRYKQVWQGVLRCMQCWEVWKDHLPLWWTESLESWRISSSSLCCCVASAPWTLLSRPPVSPNLAASKGRVLLLLSDREITAISASQAPVRWIDWGSLFMWKWSRFLFWRWPVHISVGTSTM